MKRARKRVARRRATAWRVQSDHLGRFDELVVGEHVHLEMMTGTHLWLRVGRFALGINIKTGFVTCDEDQ